MIDQLAHHGRHLGSVAVGTSSGETAIDASSLRMTADRRSMGPSAAQSVEREQAGENVVVATRQPGLNEERSRFSAVESEPIGRLPDSIRADVGISILRARRAAPRASAGCAHTGSGHAARPTLVA